MNESTDPVISRYKVPARVHPDGRIDVDPKYLEGINCEIKYTANAKYAILLVKSEPRDFSERPEMKGAAITKSRADIEGVR